MEHARECRPGRRRGKLIGKFRKYSKGGAGAGPGLVSVRRRTARARWAVLRQGRGRGRKNFFPGRGACAVGLGACHALLLHPALRPQRPSFFLRAPGVAAAGVPPCAWQGGWCRVLCISARQTRARATCLVRPEAPSWRGAAESQRFPARGRGGGRGGWSWGGGEMPKEASISAHSRQASS